MQSTLAGVVQAQGDPARAAPLLREAVQLADELGCARAIAGCAHVAADVGAERAPARVLTRVLGAARALSATTSFPLSPCQQARFDAVAIRPGKPAVFAWVGGKPVFGLPGNPLSSLLTFELFARPALALLAGAAPSAARAPTVEARLAVAYKQRPVELTVFVPATLDEARALHPLSTQGSGDLAALALSCRAS